MEKILSMKKFIILLLCLSGIAFAAENGTFYKIPNTAGLKGVRGFAAGIAIPRTTFKYTPGKTKNGVMDDLTLVDYAIAEDNSIIALAESIEQQDQTFLNRIIFMENGSFRILNGKEYKSKEKIEKIFFFAGNLFCIVKGEKTMLREVYLTRELRFASRAVILDNDITSMCKNKKFFYLKDSASTIMQFNENMEKVSELTTRRPGGVILLQNGTDKLLHFTADNLETIQCTGSGLFKSSFRDLKDVPAPVRAWYAHNKRSIYFLAEDGSLHELVDLAYCENKEIAPFKQILYNPYRREFFAIASKRNMLEILIPPGFEVRRKISHHTMRPETNQNIKMMIPHPSGVLLITQDGEFTFIRERKRRFHKTIHNK